MKVLLIEDEPIWQVNIRIILEELEWELLKISGSIDSVIEDIKETQPDVVISDILLDNIPIFSLLEGRTDFNIPIVFMTNFPNEGFYKSAMSFKHSALLIKPFHGLSLKSTVEVLFQHYTKPEKLAKLGVWVKDKHNIKVWIEEEKILWIHSNGNYCFIQTATAKYSVKAALASIIPTFSDSFIQIHRAYLVNVRHIQKVELTRCNLFINKQELPISRKYKEQVVNYLTKKEANQQLASLP
jgi:two-component system, LytTR family, response regulator LytT